MDYDAVSRAVRRTHGRTTEMLELLRKYANILRIIHVE